MRLLTDALCSLYKLSALETVRLGHCGQTVDTVCHTGAQDARAPEATGDVVSEENPRTATFTEPGVASYCRASAPLRPPSLLPGVLDPI